MSRPINPNRPELPPEVGNIGNWLILVSNGEVIWAEATNDLIEAIKKMETWAIENAKQITEHNKLTEESRFASDCHPASAIRVQVGETTMDLQSRLNQIKSILGA